MQRARVPVLKLLGAENEVLCDISVNNTEGVTFLSVAEL